MNNKLSGFISRQEKRLRELKRIYYNKNNTYYHDDERLYIKGRILELEEILNELKEITL